MNHCEQSRQMHEMREIAKRCEAMHCVQYRFCRERGVWVRYERDSGREIGPLSPGETVPGWYHGG